MGRPILKRRGWSRRDFLRRAGAAGAVAASGSWLAGCSDSASLAGGLGPREGENPFKHSVASGDPLSDRVILWTRVTPPAGMAGDIPVVLTVAEDPALQRNPQLIATTAFAARDYTVKHDALGLQPGRTYYYRFSALGFDSPVGRTRTAPVGAVDRLRVAMVSCSNFPFGFFNAYRFIAERADLDAVLHLGDYIYEYGDGEYGDLRPCEPPTEILTLEDYRVRHAQYKGDPDLQAAHRQHPWICVWDDHESTNNSRRDSAENHTEGVEGVWEIRKGWAQQAYDEWMPIRLPEPGNPNRIWRNFQFGDLMDLWMLDTRLFDRDDEVSAITDAAIFDENRHLIGPEQRDWLLGGLSASQATWKFIGQQVMFGQLKATPLPDLPVGLPLPTPLAAISGAGINDVYINGDQWDGYQAERNAILDHLANNGIDNTVVLTGDIHSSWVMDLVKDPDNLLQYNPLTGAGSLAVEFVGTSVTSPGFDQVPGLENLPEVLMAIRAANLHMKYIEGTRRGYVLLDLSPEETVGEYWFISTILERGGSEAFEIGFATAAGSNRITAQGRSTPKPPKADAPPLAP
jgi:alkaline phosphatase D